jgi:hypothetical protein
MANRQPRSPKGSAEPQENSAPKKARSRGRPFVKGQPSANPGGRPKEANDVKLLAREHTVEAIERLVHWLRSDNAKASVAAAGALLDRAWGKAPQAITGDDGGPLTVVIRRFSEGARA